MFCTWGRITSHKSTAGKWLPGCLTALLKVPGTTAGANVNMSHGVVPGKLESQYWATLRKVQQVKGAPALKRPCLKSCAQSGALQVMKDNEGLSKVQQKALRMAITWPLGSDWESRACSIWQRGRANNSPQLLERQLQ